MNPKVDAFFNSLEKWQDELSILRKIINTCGLKEDFKWMHPCYTFNNKNIVLIHGFKEYCAILFYKGALLKDHENILIQQTKNTQSGRQIRFTNSSEIEELEVTIKEYIIEAIHAEKLGLKISMKKTLDYDIPEELKEAFANNPALKKAFKNLTEGRKRGYLLFFAKPKKALSRMSRIEKNTNRILNGKGLNDCICGQSQRMPSCDGSHKYI